MSPYAFGWILATAAMPAVAAVEKIPPIAHGTQLSLFDRQIAPPKASTLHTVPAAPKGISISAPTENNPSVEAMVQVPLFAGTAEQPAVVGEPLTPNEFPPADPPILQAIPDQSPAGENSHPQTRAEPKVVAHASKIAETLSADRSAAGVAEPRSGLFNYEEFDRELREHPPKSIYRYCSNMRRCLARGIPVLRGPIPTMVAPEKQVVAVFREYHPRYIQWKANRAPPSGNSMTQMAKPLSTEGKQPDKKYLLQVLTEAGVSVVAVKDGRTGEEHETRIEDAPPAALFRAYTAILKKRLKERER